MFTQQNSMLIGYARVSRADDQDTLAQVQALKAAGCHRIYEEKASGGRWDRPEPSRSVADTKAVLGSSHPPRDGADNGSRVPLAPLRPLYGADNGVVNNRRWRRVPEPPSRRGPTSCQAVRAQTSAKAPGKQVERSGADVSGRVGGDRLQEWRSAIHGLRRAREVGEDFMDFSGIVDGGDQAQAPATSRAGEDVNLEGMLRCARRRWKASRVRA